VGFAEAVAGGGLVLGGGVGLGGGLVAELLGTLTAGGGGSAAV
jgi:hypothetical protein